MLDLGALKVTQYSSVLVELLGLGCLMKICVCVWQGEVVTLPEEGEQGSKFGN